MEIDALARADQERNVILLQSSKIMNELKDSTLQVTNIINRIEECFNILFPRLFSDVIDSSAISEEPDVLDDNFDDVDWIENDVTSSSGLNNNILNSNSSSSSSSGGSSSSSTSNVIDLAVGAVPYTISFSLDTTAQDVTTADNEILISIVRELSKQLVNHVVPRLVTWKSTLVKALNVVTNASSFNNKRKRDDDDNEKEEEDITAALSKVKQLLGQIHSVLVRKCRELLKK